MKNKYDIIWLESTDSTNEEAKRRIDICDNMSVLSALSQTSGKGQRGNTWSSEVGQNLLFSIIMKDVFRIKACDQFVISELSALAVADLLSMHGIKASIKWPNDIYVGKRKICGILVENSLRGEWINSTIIGIGLNINQRNFDVNIPNPTSMALENGNETTYDIRQLLDEFMDIFSRYADKYLNITGGYLKLRKMYLSLLWRKDEPYQYIRTSDGSTFNGIIRGISDLGHLRIENEKGESEEFAFKEISYVI